MTVVLVAMILLAIRLKLRDPWGWVGSHPAPRSRRRLLRAVNDEMGTGLTCREAKLAAACDTAASTLGNLAIGLCLGCGRRRGCTCRILTIAPRLGNMTTLERGPLRPSAAVATPRWPIDTTTPPSLLAAQAMTIDARCRNVRRMKTPREKLLEKMGSAEFEGADSRLGRAITSTCRPE